ncbi:DUF72 domain-containing protein, partial [Streptomyces tricolor]|uniref:DUF72 domain-containing protein n=1 Tax=Streptomyces tricolor TaxID=68277 RepID=UPI0039E14906
MAEILIGTCGWTDPDLLRSGWYPPGHRDPEKRLRHYATRFPLVEADSPYYALPNPRTTTLWADRTPPRWARPPPATPPTQSLKHNRPSRRTRSP